MFPNLFQIVAFIVDKRFEIRLLSLFFFNVFPIFLILNYYIYES